MTCTVPDPPAKPCRAEQPGGFQRRLFRNVFHAQGRIDDRGSGDVCGEVVRYGLPVKGRAFLVAVHRVTSRRRCETVETVDRKTRLGRRDS